MKRFAATFLVSLISVTSPAIAEPMVYQLPAETAELKPGPGVETSIARKARHFVDHISTQPPGKGKAFGQAEVQKMIKVYKAEIGEEDAAVIANYLAATY